MQRRIKELPWLEHLQEALCTSKSSGGLHLIPLIVRGKERGSVDLARCLRSLHPETPTFLVCSDANSAAKLSSLFDAILKTDSRILYRSLRGIVSVHLDTTREIISDLTKVNGMFPSVPNLLLYAATTQKGANHYCLKSTVHSPPRMDPNSLLLMLPYSQQRHVDSLWTTRVILKFVHAALHTEPDEHKVPRISLSQSRL